MNARNKMIVFATVATVLVISIGAMATSTSIAASPDNNGNNSASVDKPSKNYAENAKYIDYKDGVSRVRAGAGGHVAPVTKFFPSNVEIKVGESVTWYNPTNVPEPHTVTFTFDPSTFASPDSPYLVSNTTKFTSASPGANSDPVLMPGPNGNNVVLVANARSYSPVVVDSKGNATYLPPNATYHIDGSEKYVNSGRIWPSGQTPQGLQDIQNFTVTFDKADTYNYICLVHPWMTGTVVVK